MPKLIIDNQEIEVPEGYSILQACKVLEKEVPHFCYHDRLSVAGNCRMCLVEVEKAPKPVASCAMPVAEGMVVNTKGPVVDKARKGVMEFLLINHPLDCPICDQGGECDLQDQAMSYGFDKSRFEENKRAVKNKNFGPLVKTIMTRCIHCTRCVRFITEVAGVADIGGLYRGEKMEIGNFVEKAVASELSGNIIDLCPVGALTSKPYQFKARSWELRKTESVDVLDALGSNIRIDSRGPEVMRVLPRLNEDINEEWISDKTRFSYDGLLKQRLDAPYIRNDKGQLQKASWKEALQVVSDRLKMYKPNEIAAIAGPLTDCETMVAVKDLMSNLSVTDIDYRQTNEFLDNGQRENNLFNTEIANIEEADFCLLIGADPRWEAPILNARIRKRWLSGNLEVASIGPAKNLTYDVNWLGENPQILQEILNQKHDIAKKLEKAQKPMLIIGQSIFLRDDAEAIFNMALGVAEKFGLIQEEWNGFNRLHAHASNAGAIDLGFFSHAKDTKSPSWLKNAKNKKLVYLIGADDVDFTALKKSFVIYQGHHGDKAANHADVILPGSAYTEKTAHYVNTEGRVQQAVAAVFPPGEAKEDWKIIKAISDEAKASLPYKTLEQIQKRLTEVSSVFEEHDIIHAKNWNAQDINTNLKVSDERIGYLFDNFYKTDVISRASKTMSDCLKAFVNNSDNEKEEVKQVANG